MQPFIEIHSITICVYINKKEAGFHQPLSDLLFTPPQLQQNTFMAYANGLDVRHQRISAEAYIRYAAQANEEDNATDEPFA